MISASEFFRKINPFPGPDDTNILAGLIFIAGGASAVYVGLYAPNARPTAVTLALASFGIGALLGFLFGIPRTSTGTATTTETGETVPGVKTATGYEIRPNTNLEQISDWLTKILVGIGLTELRSAPRFVRDTALSLSEPFKQGDEQPGKNAFVYALALLLYFSVFGFFAGYLVTRVILTRVFSAADREVMDSASTKVRAVPLEASPDDQSTLDRATQVAADKIAAKPMADMVTAEALATWAKVQFRRNNLVAAKEAYERALRLDSSDIQTRQEYSVVLAKLADDTPESRRHIIAELDIARAGLTDSSDTKLARRIYVDLTYHSLYLPKPEGFTNAIKWAEDYEKRPKAPVSGAILTNLLCAYGQEYAYRTSVPDPQRTPAAVREDALAVLRRIVAAKKTNAIAHIRVLLTKGASGKADDDDDLDVFSKDKAFRTIVGLS